MLLALDVAALTVLLFAVQECLRRAGLWAAWAVFLVLPLALTPYWARVNEFGVFAWAKLYTVLFSACWFTALRFTALGRRGWALRLATALFALNILEAAAVDLVAWRPAQGLNTVAGVILVATLPKAGDAGRIDTGGRFRDLRYHGIDRGWIVGFVLWNWTFLYLNFPVIAGHHVAVLGAALVVGVADPRRWLQARISILATDLMAFATFGAVLVPWADTSHWSDPRLEMIAAGTTLAFVTGCAVGAFRNRTR